MRGKDLLECIEYIDDALVQEAMEPTVFPRNNKVIVRWGMAAACAVVIGVSATALWSHQNVRNAQIGHSHEDADIGMEAADRAAAENRAYEGADDGIAGNTGSAGNPESADGAGSAGGAGTAGSTGAAETADGTKAAEGAGTADDTDTSGSANRSTDTNADVATPQDNSAELDLQESKEQAVAESAKLEYTIIRQGYKREDDSAAQHPLPKSFPAPANGTVLRTQELQETIAYYEGGDNVADSTEYAYEVVIELYGDVQEDSDGTAAWIEQEYLRLSELGCNVQLSEEFRLTGIFTREEMDAFPAAPEYGYLFEFADD